MTRVALLPSLALPHALDEVRDLLRAHDVDARVVTPQSHYADPIALNAELAARLSSLGTFDLVVAVEHTADAAVAGRGSAHVVLVDPPLGDVMLALLDDRPLGETPPPVQSEPHMERQLRDLITDTLAEAAVEEDPLLVRYAREAVAALRDRLPVTDCAHTPVPTLRWAADARQGADYLQIWLTQAAATEADGLLRNWPDGWPGDWCRILRWSEMWWWTEPRQAADAIAYALSRPG